MLRLIKAEFVKTFLKKRTYLGFVVVAIVIPIVVLAFQTEGGRLERMAARNLANDFLILGKLTNGWSVTHQIMNALWIHVPLLITFVAGDMLAGEATAGTYRLVLTRSVSRTAILFVKYLVTFIYVIVFVIFLGVLSAGLSVLLLGTGDLLVFHNGILVLPADDLFWRFALAYGLAIWSMMTVASIAFFASSFVENAIGPIVATMGLIIVFTILTFLPIEALDPARDYMFTYHMAVWQKAFEDPVPWSEIVRSLINLSLYTGGAFAGAWLVFLRKDILS